MFFYNGANGFTFISVGEVSLKFRRQDIQGGNCMWL